MPRVGEKSRYPRLPRDKKAERPAAFSPGGRLLQIEYARECPMGGPLALAMRTRGGVVLAKARSAEPELGHRIPGIWNVTSRIAYVANGNLGDLYYLRDVLADGRARSTSAIAKAIRRVLHEHAVRTDVRPLAIMLLLASVEGNRTEIRGFDVTGSEWECDAWALGEGDLLARDQMIKEWRPEMRLDAAETLVRRIYGRRRFVSTFLRHRRGG
ncbi:MAG: hypothetical protein E6K13_02295 [Methanobacteriota archaeon]|nr:MAG: hypothetical protein E6K13_02295 [Euryarchaeota archaeon]